MQSAHVEAVAAAVIAEHPVGRGEREGRGGRGERAAVPQHGLQARLQLAQQRALRGLRRPARLHDVPALVGEARQTLGSETWR